MLALVGGRVDYANFEQTEASCSCALRCELPATSRASEISSAGLAEPKLRSAGVDLSIQVRCGHVAAGTVTKHFAP